MREDGESKVWKNGIGNGTEEREEQEGNIHEERLLKGEEDAGRASIKKKSVLTGNDGDEEKMLGTRDKREDITATWWNGGGKLITRIIVNPVLK